MQLTEKDFAELSEKLDEVIRISHGGILGNARASLAEINGVVRKAKEVLYRSKIDNGPEAA